jgi:hypothetical protein
LGLKQGRRRRQRAGGNYAGGTHVLRSKVLINTSFLLQSCFFVKDCGMGLIASPNPLEKINFLQKLETGNRSLV